ncbi:MAG: serine/threonine-protein kinase [Pseudomonadota bacterium]
MQPVTLGKYQLLKKIATGGMAEIFVARATGLPGFEKIVVVKRILAQHASKPDFIRMFLDEARIAATLHHPNIVQMYDIGAVEGAYFISMEYLHGEDVRTLMRALRQKNEGLPPEHALNIVIGIAAGLHYAHEKRGFDGKLLGIVHRDVNPQNVFVTYDGGVRLVDFGIAKATNRSDDTKMGMLKGKIPYMSPEQARSEDLDRRSDVYAAGIMLYELTTGRRLYKGTSEFEILKRIVEDPVAPPSVVRPGYPSDLEKIVMKALAKDRGERYPTAQALQADLEEFGREHRLVISPIALAEFMERVFGKKSEAWREALATGRDLVDQIAERGEDSDPDLSQLVAEVNGSLENGRDTPGTPSALGEMARSSSAKRGTARADTAIAAGMLQGQGGRKKRSRAAAIGIAGLGAAAVLAVAAGIVLLKPNVLGGLVGLGGKTESARAGTAQSAEAGASAEGELSATRVRVWPAVQAAGLVKISTRPAGATIRIDGSLWPERAPAVVDGLVPGDHLVDLEWPGHGSRRAVVSIKENETSSLFVALDGQNLDAGVPADAGTDANRQQIPTAVDVALASASSPPQSPPPSSEEDGSAKGRDDGSGSASHQRNPRAPNRPRHPGMAAITVPAGIGELRIASSPSCEVIVDGKARGATPLAGLMLPAGNHTVQLVNSRFGIDRTLTVQVKPDEVTKRKYDFSVEGN